MELVNYKVKPRIRRKYWLFGKKIKVYDVLKVTVGEYWSDETYGNGGGEFVEYTEIERIHTFKSKIEAGCLRDELEVYEN